MLVFNVARPSSFALFEQEISLILFVPVGLLAEFSFIYDNNYALGRTNLNLIKQLCDIYTCMIIFLCGILYIVLPLHAS